MRKKKRVNPAQADFPGKVRVEPAHPELHEQKNGLRRLKPILCRSTDDAKSMGTQTIQSRMAKGVLHESIGIGSLASIDPSCIN